MTDPPTDPLEGYRGDAPARRAAERRAACTHPRTAETGLTCPEETPDRGFWCQPCRETP